jgi:hypothetical protein
MSFAAAVEKRLTGQLESLWKKRRLYDKIRAAEHDLETLGMLQAELDALEAAIQRDSELLARIRGPVESRGSSPPETVPPHRTEDNRPARSQRQSPTRRAVAEEPVKQRSPERPSLRHVPAMTSPALMLVSPMTATPRGDDRFHSARDSRGRPTEANPWHADRGPSYHYESSRASSRGESVPHTYADAKNGHPMQQRDNDPYVNDPYRSQPASRGSSLHRGNWEATHRIVPSQQPLYADPVAHSGAAVPHNVSASGQSLPPRRRPPSASATA